MNIGEYFTFGLPGYVRYVEEFAISRFVILRFYSIHFTVPIYMYESDTGMGVQLEL